MRNRATHPQGPEKLDLPAIRQKKGISLHQIAQSTKISVRFLQAIESGQFDQLPGGIYSISYIRQYARALQVDESAILAYYWSADAS